jgi:RHS repeat-associated protein
LENDDFTFATETDALGRIIKQTTPDGSVITPSYNEAGLLGSETVTHADPAVTTVYIKDIDYNEKGRREKIIYGNDVVTRFYYDKETFRLQRLETKRQSNDPLQDWHYTFDPVGNITHIEDKNIPVVFFDNQKITGVSTYTYDALYRLVEATGRENDTPLTFDGKDNCNYAPFMHQLNPGDPMAMRNYTQSYQYDDVVNILQMKHQAAGNNWTRDYSYQAANNRLISTQVGENTYTYPHHSRHGYMTAMPHLEDMGWNFKEELIKTIRQKRIDGGTPETTYYQYDGQGQRVRKITENQADAGNTPAKKEERIYIAGYELYKKHSGADAGLERISLSLMDESHRFAMIETRNDIDDGTEKHLVRYQLHNHLGSACLELDGTGNAKVISYEEYHPYGTTAYQARNAAIKATAKRYRYTGMERDEESGLEYHSARYYLPWLGRWLSCDPLFKGNQVTNQNSKPADNEDRKNHDTETMLSSFTYGNKGEDQENPDGHKLPYQYLTENCRSGKTDGQSHKPQQRKNPPAFREQTLPDQERLSDLKNLNLYAYCSQNPIIYHDPTGNVGIIQAWYEGYDSASTAGKVGYGFLFILAYLAHVIVNLIVLIFAVFIQNLLAFWDFSYGAPQSIIGLGAGIIFTLLGADGQA